LLEPGLSHDGLLQMLVQGRVRSYQVTLVEGQTVAELVAVLQAHPQLEATLQQTDPEHIAKILGIAGSAEGWIYPDTYQFTRGTTDKQVLKRAYQAMQQLLEQEWAERAAKLPLKNAYDALILASIVEKETGAAFERPAIAGVFTRRLQKGMRLQTDPTVIYGMGERYNGNITRADLKRQTPYNTYRIKGLPPTPIANPGRAAIHAALNPEAGKALYFVAKGDGSHQFSATLSEHNRAVTRFQRHKRRQNYRSAPAERAQASSSSTSKSDS
ncbi:MAG: endolytic transglycosylase MltG, partial [Halopseudomonas sp.]